MKGIHLIAIAFLASWTVISAELPTIFEAEYECPKVDPCPPKLIRHETNCAKYYECKYGQRLERSCSSGLYFSKSWRGCVDRQISDCPITTPTPTTPTTPPPIGECIHGQLLEHECKCTKFYECIYGRKALRDCPAGHRFIPATQTCIPGTNCNGGNDPPPCVEGTYSPHECQCQKYYVCKGGQKALRECDKGTYFDNVTLQCVPGENCKPSICTNGDAKKHQCDKYCDRYYRCINNDWLLEYCPNDEHFSETQKKCMNKFKAGCDRNIIPGGCSSSSPSRWPHECDCRLYYQCENGQKKIYDCTWGYYFNDALLRCDIASNVKNCVNDWDGWV